MLEAASPTPLTCPGCTPTCPQVLRDSLGGNCKTVMVATLSPDEMQSEETISTCRFSQRVALISNRLELNEEVDPS